MERVPLIHPWGQPKVNSDVKFKNQEPEFKKTIDFYQGQLTLFKKNLCFFKSINVIIADHFFVEFEGILFSAKTF